MTTMVEYEREGGMESRGQANEATKYFPFKSNREKNWEMKSGFQFVGPKIPSKSFRVKMKNCQHLDERCGTVKNMIYTLSESRSEI